VAARVLACRRLSDGYAVRASEKFCSGRCPCVNAGRPARWKIEARRRGTDAWGLGRRKGRALMRMRKGPSGWTRTWEAHSLIRDIHDTARGYMTLRGEIVSAMNFSRATSYDN